MTALPQLRGRLVLFRVFVDRSYGGFKRIYEFTRRIRNALNRL